MSHNHKHDNDKSSSNLRAAFFLNLAFTIFELFGGMYVNSVAIISDAIHDLGDSFSLGTAWYLNEKSKKSATNNFTFGYKRFSLLGALINCIVLIIGSIFVLIEASERIFNPQHSDAEGMFVFAIIGICINGYAAWKISTGKSFNEKVITWHLIEDVLGWFSILIVSIVLMFEDIHYLDPTLSILITLYILWNVIKNLKETLFIFLQGNPKDINLNQIESEILKIKNINSLHHTHIWSLDGEHHVFTTHVKIGEISGLDELLKVKNELKCLLEKYPFEHYTIETELDSELCGLDNNKKYNL